MTKSRTPRPPRGLGPAGRGLWRDVLAEFELSLVELRELGHLAMMADELARLEAELASGALLQTGARGAVFANPLIAEARRHRESLAKLLGLLLADGAAASSALTSTAARRMALKKHHGSPAGLAAS